MIENAANLTLDELRTALAPAIADSAIFDGWSETALLTAADMEGVDPGWKVPPELQGKELPQASVFDELERMSRSPHGAPGHGWAYEAAAKRVAASGQRLIGTGER